ncbi:MAG: hypothetical protein LBQ76_07680 [Candidatus Fibromonas sp.]|nr:hypothetical protein [Candidatus Fibromonas sp.]
MVIIPIWVGADLRVCPSAVMFAPVQQWPHLCGDVGQPHRGRCRQRPYIGIGNFTVNGRMAWRKGQTRRSAPTHTARRWWSHQWRILQPSLHMGDRKGRPYIVWRLCHLGVGYAVFQLADMVVELPEISGGIA